MGEVRIFSLSLYPETDTTISDYWIKNTVINILSDFLKKDHNVIFYVCDNMDEREDQRHKVFEYWYKKATAMHEFIAKYNYEFHSKYGYKINSSIIYNKNNYLSDYIIEQFKKEIEI